MTLLEANVIPQSSRLHYDTDSFVAVTGKENSSSVQLWNGWNVGRIKHYDRSSKHLKVQWYERFGDSNIVRSK